MKHKASFFIILVVVMIIPHSVKAYTFSAVAPSGQTLYYYIDGEDAVVTYPGTWDGDIYSCSGTDCYRASGNLIIPDSVSRNGNTYSVTAIGDKAFCYCNQLSTVVIPSSVTSIGVKAFYGCSGLTSVTIPNSVTSIGDRAFYNCSGLTGAISIPSIGDYAFYNCSGLTSVTIGNLATNIGESAFENCSGLTEITSMSSVAPSLGLGAFSSVSTTIPINIPCGSAMSYYSRWSYFSIFIEDESYNFNTQSADNSMGTVSILTEKSCQSQTTVFMAIANNGYHFSHWSDGDTDNPRILTLTQDSSITAIFDVNPLQNNVIVNNAVGGGVYSSGSETMIYALPQMDLQFAGWSDGESANPRYIVVTSDTSLTAIYRAPDTVRIYDTIINIVYDTTEYNHYYFDTTHVYDTLIVLDTTRVFDTLIVFDTTRVFDTIVYVKIDTLHHYYYDTTRTFDTMLYVNIDTLHHYYYDTTRVFDTMVYVNIDTLHHYYFDTTITFDTLVYVNRDTLYHYYFDTTSMTHYIFDSIWFFDSVWVFDSVYIFDTIYIYDTIVVGVNEVDAVNAKIYTSQGRIVVEGTEGNIVWLYDVNGRVLATKQDKLAPLHFDVPASGAYIVKIGNNPARKVVVIR